MKVFSEDSAEVEVLESLEDLKDGVGFMVCPKGYWFIPNWTHSPPEGGGADEYVAGRLLDGTYRYCVPVAGPFTVVRTLKDLGYLEGMEILDFLKGGLI